MTSTQAVRGFLQFLSVWARNCALLVFAGNASASVLILAGNNPQPDQENVLLTRSALAETSIIGHTNQTNALVEFISMTGELIAAGPNGQSFITGAVNREGANGGTMWDVSIGLANSGAFTGLIFGVNLPGVGHASACTGCIRYSVAGTATSSGILPGTIGPGTTFFTFLALAGDRMTSVTVSGVGSHRLEDIRQVRISGFGQAEVTDGEILATGEPATLILFGCGLTTLGFARRRRLAPLTARSSRDADRGLGRRAKPQTPTCRIVL